MAPHVLSLNAIICVIAWLTIPELYTWTDHFNSNSDEASTCQTRQQEYFLHKLCVTGLLQLAWPIVPVCVVPVAHNEKEN